MTNETLHTLETRRSCRAYKPEQITKEELEAVLRAGTFAPSAMNRQSAKIVVVQDAETRAQLTRMNAAVMGNTGDPMYGAPTILVVLADANARCGVQDGSLGTISVWATAFWATRQRNPAPPPPASRIISYTHKEHYETRLQAGRKGQIHSRQR